MNAMANKPAAGNAGIASQLTIEHHWPGVPEPERSATNARLSTMANRSYLYTRHTGDEVEFRDIAEWNYDIPVAHLILVGANSTPCKSAIWTVDEKIAIEGDANISRSLFLRLLEWLTPQVDPGFANAAKEAREYLTRADRQGDRFHLELGGNIRTRRARLA